MTTTSGGPGPELTSIEILAADVGPGAQAGPDRTGPAEPLARRVPWPTVAGAVLAVLAIAGALVALSRSGGSQPPPTSVAPITTLPGAVAPADLSPFAQLPADLPPELPGLLLGFDSLGSLVVVDRAGDRPYEVHLGLIPDPGAGAHGLGLGGSEPLWFAQALASGSVLGAVGPSGDPLGEGIDLRLLGPEAEVLLAERSPAGLEAAVVPLNHLATRENNDLRWLLPADGTRLLGVWQGQLLVTQAARTWLLGASGSGPAPAPVAVGDGEVLGFDGVHLVRRACTAPGTCSLLVGPPDQPDRFTVPPPLAPAQGAEEAAVGSWAGPVAVSPDGARLAAAVRFGDLTWLTVIDLATGAVERYDSSLEPGALVSWAPDGAWLAFQTGGDVQIRRQSDGRTWILGLDRNLVTLRWTAGPAR